MLENYIEVVIEKVNFILQSDKKIGLDDDLIFLGMNSISSIKLIVLLEETFNTTFDDEALLFENFSTINKIIGILEPKLNIK